jgi:hypothetical protein
MQQENRFLAGPAISGTTVNGRDDSLAHDAVPAMLVIGSCAATEVFPQSLIDGVARGWLQLERVAGVHAAAARIVSAPPGTVAGVLIDVSRCSAREVASIAVFTRAGVAVWLVGTDQKPARTTDAISRGGQRWSLENRGFRQQDMADAARAAVETPPEVHPSTRSILQPAEADGTMNVSPPDDYDNFVEQPVVSNAEMRALLGTSE